MTKPRKKNNRDRATPRELHGDHVYAYRRFAKAIRRFLSSKVLSDKQAEIVLDHVELLAKRDYNAANTGNLEDLFTYTLQDTKDPVRAFAQMLADSTKIVPMPAQAKLLPPVKDKRPKSVTRNKTLRRVEQLELAGPQAMLVTHTNVAYSDPEFAEEARAMLKATYPRSRASTLERRFQRMVMQSQHMPSSSFVLAAATGLVFQTKKLFTDAGCTKKQIAAAHGFFSTAAEFNPKWLGLFMSAGPRDDPSYLAWLDRYHQHRAGLPDDLKYQLYTDTLTNFLPGTMHSGKWVDAVVQFSNVRKLDGVPPALAKVVNQYLAEFVDLHRGSPKLFVRVVKKSLAKFGVVFRDGRFCDDEVPEHEVELVRHQFDTAWDRRIASGVLKSSPLFQALGSELSARLLQRFEHISFSQGEVVQHRGDQDRGLIVVVDGEVEVTVRRKRGKPQQSLAHAGDVIGEISLLSDQVATSEVVAKEDTVALLLDAQSFKRTASRYVDLHNFLVDLDVKQLRHLRRGRAVKG